MPDVRTGGVGQGGLTHFQDQEITVNASLTHTVALEHTADLQRAARDARIARLDEEPAHQPRRAPRFIRLLHVRRTRVSGQLATAPESCDA
jgi:hypothetical protein